MRIVKYAVIYTDSCEELSERVTKAIDKGWQPYGSPTFSEAEDGDLSAYQPMVRYAQGSCHPALKHKEDAQ